MCLNAPGGSGYFKNNVISEFFDVKTRERSLTIFFFINSNRFE